MYKRQGWFWIDAIKTHRYGEVQLETETVTGYVDHIIYRNAENGYTVLVLVAVSYTHLDVYKRQLQDCLRKAYQW